MCPVKTENLALNVARAEAEFWRKLAFRLGAKSRGTLQKTLLLLGLEALHPREARRLREIRRAGAAAALLALFLGILVLDHGGLQARTRQARARRADNFAEAAELELEEAV